MHITLREREILIKICQGLSCKEIGHMLYISQHTVETHKRNMINKLKARNTVHLAVMAHQSGLLSHQFTTDSNNDSLQL